MVDIHTHILPGVDDGSSSFSESVEMLKASVKDGIKTVVLTPHVFSPLSKISDISKLRKIFDDFKAKVDKLDLGVEVLLGSENYFVSGLKEKLGEFHDILTINGSDYFLLEFPMVFTFPETKEFIYDALNKGCIPVLCHPERNADIQEDLFKIYEFVRAGALVQVDAGSITGEFGYKAAAASELLLKNNLVHVISSDCHDMNERKPGISRIKKNLNCLGEQKIDILLYDIPRAIIKNQGIPETGPISNPSVSRTIFTTIREKMLTRKIFSQRKI